MQFPVVCVLVCVVQWMSNGGWFAVVVVVVGGEGNGGQWLAWLPVWWCDGG
jgi:hypothetical protein